MAAAALPLKQKLKLFRQSVYANLSFRGHTPISVEADPLGAVIKVEGKSIYAPSPLRWKLYKKGWSARLKQLSEEYGVGRHVTLNENSIVLDIGANAGEFAYVAAKYGARIYCIEPDPRVFSCLKANVSSLSNASAHDALIWKENTDLCFFSAPDTADSSVFDEGQGEKIIKPAQTAEQFCKDHHIAHIDLLKCDAEGAEPEILEGLGEMFSHIGVIALDTGAERQGARTNKECRAILEGAGFTVIDEKVGKRLMTFGINPSSKAAIDR